MQVEIRILNGPTKGQQYTFDKPDRFLCGRSSDARLCLIKDVRVSRRHTLFEISPPICQVTDLDSTNGLIVNNVRYGGRSPLNKKITQAPEDQKTVRLKDGDKLLIGKTCMKITIFGQTGEASLDTRVPSPSKTLILSDAPAIEGYRIEDIIDDGGIGGVYGAMEIATRKRVAIKVLHSHTAANPKNVMQFEREIELLRQLDHTHIVQLFKHGRIHNTFYFVFELVSGVNLAQFLKSRGGVLTLEEAIPLFFAMLDGLAYAHQAELTTTLEDGTTKACTGVVHRDLKPQHILLTRQGANWIPKISGFGIAKTFETAGFTNITESGQISGTPVYWPREQITHYRYLSPATDVFSLAAIFYEMLTGTWVRDGFAELFETYTYQDRSPSIAEYMQVILHNPPVPLRTRKPAIPKEIAHVIDRALKEAEIPYHEQKMHHTLTKMRYPDASHFRDALFQAVEAVGLGHKTISYSIMQPASRKHVAMLVLDLENSSQYIFQLGDTFFSNVIGEFYRRIKSHHSAKHLTFLKTTGDGFLAVFDAIPDAYSLGVSFLDQPVADDIHVRMGLHWGGVKIGPQGDVFGREVHRTFRIEGVQQRDRVYLVSTERFFPREDRIVITREGLERLPVEEQQRFKPIGKFALKGFTELCDLLVLHK